MKERVMYMSDTICQVVEKFINNKIIRYRYRPSMVERLLRGYTENDAKKNKEKNIKTKEYAFLAQESIKNIINKKIDDSDAQEAIGIAIKESVKSYTRDKSTAVNVYKDFVSFISETYQINISVEFPPVFSSAFDRQMYIVKELHEKSKSIADIEDKLWVSNRTIEEDLAKLRSDVGVSILERKVRIRGVERLEGRIEFESTVHPIFLALNLTQVVVLLQGLKYMAGDRAYKEYPLKLSVNIWNELSDYARRRIKQVTNMLSMDLSWYEELDSMSSEELFYTEHECSYEEREGNILDFLKNGKKCAIEYISNGGEIKILTNCFIKKIYDSTKEIDVISNGEKYTISLDTIIRTKKEAKHLY
jgi:hypothetical protein